MSQSQVDEWNDTFPVGSPCQYRISKYDPWVDSVTTSTAWLLGHGDAVVCVKGKSGGYGIGDFVCMTETHTILEGGR